MSVQKTFKEKLPAYQFHALQKFSDQLDHAVFTRQGGVSKPPFDSLNISFDVVDRRQDVEKNRQLIIDSFRLAPENFISAHQTHSKNVLVIDEERLRYHDSTQEVENIDAFVTQLPEVGLMIKVADCQAIVMFDPVTNTIANVHAGWKGLVQDISGATIKVMHSQFGVNPENIFVGISPSLGPCCSFFSNPEEELPENFRPYTKENRCVDLWQFGFDQLQYHGVKPENIELARVCSYCGGGGKFFSFRRDRGVTGRFGTVVMLNRKDSLKLIADHGKK